MVDSCRSHLGLTEDIINQLRSKLTRYTFSSRQYYIKLKHTFTTASELSTGCSEVLYYTNSGRVCKLKAFWPLLGLKALIMTFCYFARVHTTAGSRRGCGCV